MGQIPYWIGGPMLVWCFGAGGKNALQTTRQKAAGVVFYYIAAAASKMLINQPVKLFKGVDLNRKYKDVVALGTETKDGYSRKKSELHDVYESIDFTRWDLLYDQGSKVSKNPTLVNKEYDEIARRMGVDKDLNDPDSTVRPYVKKIIVTSRAWKSALIIPLAAMAAGLSNYEGWRDVGNNLSKDVKKLFEPINGMQPTEKLRIRLKGTGKIISNNLLKPLWESVKEMWTGKGIDGKITKHFGKAAILGTVAAVVLANINILCQSLLKKDRLIDFSSFPGVKRITDRANAGKLSDSPLKRDREYNF
jgi:hypothetical protein